MKYLRIALIVLGVMFALVAGLLAVGAWQYHQGMAINTQNGIDEAGYVRIGGIDQWVQIRGRDKSNPVLLWLNGGPGASTIGLTYAMRDWEKSFTVVMWDQRGEGKTFDKSGPSVAPTMTINRMAQDGIELTEYLRHRLHKDKIIVLGHSWGTILGVHMVHQRPDMFYVYVGTGQTRQMRADIALSHPRLLERAEAEHNRKAVEELRTAGPPPYSDDRTYLAPVLWANELDPPIRFSGVTLLNLPGYLWATLVNPSPVSSKGWDFSVTLLWKPILAENLSIAAPRLDVPVVIIEGSEDLVTPSAKVWLDSITAPHKELLMINGGGHLALLGRRFDFLKLLVSHVRPLAR